MPFIHPLYLLYLYEYREMELVKKKRLQDRLEEIKKLQAMKEVEAASAAIAIQNKSHEELLQDKLKQLKDLEDMTNAENLLNSITATAAANTAIAAKSMKENPNSLIIVNNKSDIKITNKSKAVLHEEEVETKRKKVETDEAITTNNSNNLLEDLNKAKQAAIEAAANLSKLFQTNSSSTATTTTASSSTTVSTNVSKNTTIDTPQEAVDKKQLEILKQKRIVDSIPTDKMKLYSYTINWEKCFQHHVSIFMFLCMCI